VVPLKAIEDFRRHQYSRYCSTSLAAAIDVKAEYVVE
jgi:hypothetical protein